MTNLRAVAALTAFFVVTSGVPAVSAETELRFLNTAIFGKSANEAIVLLEPGSKSAVSPETILVDVDQNTYIAATLRYPKSLSMSQAKRCINKRYGKWESKNFADDPEMGIWRNEEDEASMQLTEDEHNIVLIYIKYSLVREELFSRGLERAFREMEHQEAEKAGGELDSNNSNGSGREKSR